MRLFSGLAFGGKGEAEKNELLADSVPLGQSKTVEPELNETTSKLNNLAHPQVEPCPPAPKEPKAPKAPKAPKPTRETRGDRDAREACDVRESRAIKEQVKEPQVSSPLSTRVEDAGEAASAGAPAVTQSRYKAGAIPLRMLGFGLLMGWHFLILYFPELSMDPQLDAWSSFVGQIILNGSLCFSFAFFGVVFSRNHGWVDAHLRTICLVGIGVAIVGCLIFALTSAVDAPIPYQISIGVMGLCEGLFMLLWFHFYADTQTNYTVSYLAVSAMMGGIICYFTRHLTEGLPIVVFVALPLLSMLLFLPSIQTTAFRDSTLHGKGMSSWEPASGPFFRTTLQLVVFSLCFGFMQGSAVLGNALDFPVENPVTNLGFCVAGVILYVVYLRSPEHQDLMPAHIISIVLFLIGITYIPFAQGVASVVISTISMTGFMLFDIVILGFLLNLVRVFDLDAELVLGSNRAAEYGAFTVGITLSAAASGLFGMYPMFPYFVTCTAALGCGITVLVLFVDSDNIWGERKEKHRQVEEKSDGDESDVSEGPGRWKLACNDICCRYDLSPRERDVFMLIAKGRNAEYVQNVLYISGHTAKTHISNIYKKLDIHSVQELLDLVEAEKAEKEKLTPQR